MKPIERSSKLDGVCYDIRGPIAQEAKRMEEEGHRILKLNIGNPAPFGFEAPDEILKHVIHNLPTAQGYSDSQGIYPARVAVAQYYQQRFNVYDAENSPTVREFLTDQMKPIGTIDEKSVQLPPSPYTEEELLNHEMENLFQV